MRSPEKQGGEASGKEEPPGNRCRANVHLAGTSVRMLFKNYCEPYVWGAEQAAMVLPKSGGALTIPMRLLAPVQACKNGLQ